MSLVQLHPEELLDREARDELSPSEHDALHAHLDQCPVCRFEHQVRNDFIDELDADDGHLDVSDLVSKALLAVGSGASPPAPLSGNTTEAEGPLSAPAPLSSPSPVFPQRGPGGEDHLAPAPRRVRRPFRPVMVALIAAAALCAGAAAAAWSGLVRPASLFPVAPSEPAALTTGEAPRKTAPAAVVPRASASGAHDEPAPEPPAPAAIPTTPASPATPGTAATPATTPRSTTASTAQAPRTPSPSVPSPSPSLAGISAEGSGVRASGGGPEEKATPSAAALFARASEARRAGDDAQAQSLYRELIRLYPASAEARVGRAALGKLLLERGEGAAALERFNESLSAGAGAMTEEMMVGQAQAHQRLGNAGAEAASWRALLAAYPRSIHAARARARLAELGPR